MTLPPCEPFDGKAYLAMMRERKLAARAKRGTKTKEQKAEWKRKRGISWAMREHKCAYMCHVRNLTRYFVYQDELVRMFQFKRSRDRFYALMDEHCPEKERPTLDLIKRLVTEYNDPVCMLAKYELSRRGWLEQYRGTQ